MAETRMQFWHRRGRALHAMRKAELCALYRKLGGLGGIHPPEKWTKEEVVNAVADIEWDRLPDDAKKSVPEHISPPCDQCGKGEYVSAHTYGGSHNYHYTADPRKEWVPSREPCSAPDCGRPYEHHETWNLGHAYTAPAEEQPATPAEATAPECTPNCDGADMCTGPSEPRYIERRSGSPVRVDGPGCTPAVVPEPFRPADLCAKCKRPFDPGDTAFDGNARHADSPFCRGCVDACHDTEIADHWCVIDQWRTDKAASRARTPDAAPEA